MISRKTLLASEISDRIVTFFTATCSPLSTTRQQPTNPYAPFPRSLSNSYRAGSSNGWSPTKNFFLGDEGIPEIAPAFTFLIPDQFQQQNPDSAVTTVLMDTLQPFGNAHSAWSRRVQGPLDSYAPAMKPEPLLNRFVFAGPFPVYTVGISTAFRT